MFAGATVPPAPACPAFADGLRDTGAWLAVMLAVVVAEGCVKSEFNAHINYSARYTDII